MNSDFNMSFKITGEIFKEKPVIEITFDRNERHADHFNGLVWDLLKPLLERFTIATTRTPSQARLWDLQSSRAMSEGYHIAIYDYTLGNQDEYFEYARTGIVMYLFK